MNQRKARSEQPAQLPLVPEGGVALQVTTLEITTLSNDALLGYRLAVDEHKAELDAIQQRIDVEIERRMRRDNSRELAHPAFDKIELEEQFTAYVYDVEKLKAAAEKLKKLGKPDDAAKLVKHVPEEVTVVPAHDAAGNPRSIASIAGRFGGEIKTLLDAGMTRQSLGTRLVVRVKRVSLTVAGEKAIGQ